MLNTKTLAVIVGAMSLGLGLWAVIGDTAAMGMAAGAVGFVAGLMALLPADSTTNDHTIAEPAAPAGPDPAEEPEPISLPEPAGPESEADPMTFLDTSGSEDEPASSLNGAALTDPETELFSEDYLKVALDSRLASARRHLRPVALAVLEVSEGLPDDGPMPATPTTVAAAVNDTLRDSDIACRLNNGTFAVILEDTPENGAVWTVERIRRNLVSASGHHTLWAGVACYPAHAFDGPELLTAVHQALESAKAWNQDRIEVAVSE